MLGDVISHFSFIFLQADCQETGISPVPNASNRVWDYFGLYLLLRL